MPEVSSPLSASLALQNAAIGRAADFYSGKTFSERIGTSAATGSFDPTYFLTNPEFSPVVREIGSDLLTITIPRATNGYLHTGRGLIARADSKLTFISEAAHIDARASHWIVHEYAVSKDRKILSKRSLFLEPVTQRAPNPYISSIRSITIGPDGTTYIVGNQSYENRSLTPDMIIWRSQSDGSFAATLVPIDPTRTLRNIVPAGIGAITGRAVVSTGTEQTSRPYFTSNNIPLALPVDLTRPYGSYVASMGIDPSEKLIFGFGSKENNIPLIWYSDLSGGPGGYFTRELPPATAEAILDGKAMGSKVLLFLDTFPVAALPARDNPLQSPLLAVVRGGLQTKDAVTGKVVNEEFRSALVRYPTMMEPPHTLHHFSRQVARSDGSSVAVWYRPSQAAGYFKGEIIIGSAELADQPSTESERSSIPAGTPTRLPFLWSPGMVRPVDLNNALSSYGAPTRNFVLQKATHSPDDASFTLEGFDASAPTTIIDTSRARMLSAITEEIGKAR